MTRPSQLLEHGLNALDIKMPARGRQQVLDYLALLDHWNKTINLTGLRAPDTRLRRLVLEPMWVAQSLGPSGHYLDVGSGNGSPAIPWAIFAEFASTTLVEARGRRATFLEVLARKLGLPRVSVRATRFDGALAGLPAADWVTLQGVRLDRRLLDNLRLLNPGVKIVWLTRNGRVPETPAMRLEIPDSDREALVFGPPEGTPSGRG